MDLVAAAQLSFPVVCTDASLLSNCSAHVFEMLLCCSALVAINLCTEPKDTVTVTVADHNGLPSYGFLSFFLSFEWEP